MTMCENPPPKDPQLADELRAKATGRFPELGVIVSSGKRKLPTRQRANPIAEADQKWKQANSN